MIISIQRVAFIVQSHTTKRSCFVGHGSFCLFRVSGRLNSLKDRRLSPFCKPVHHCGIRDSGSLRFIQGRTFTKRVKLICYGAITAASARGLYIGFQSAHGPNLTTATLCVKPTRSDVTPQEMTVDNILQGLWSLFLWHVSRANPKILRRIWRGTSIGSLSSRHRQKLETFSAFYHGSDIEKFHYDRQSLISMQFYN
jgi:hypothetical protein